MAECDVILTQLDATERVCAMQHELMKPIVQVVHNSMWQTEGYLAMGAQMAVYNTEMGT